MKIKELIVRKTKPSEEIIREIIFNEKGLSLIIDDTPKDMRESGNSVGKSTAIKIIDLCLGAKSTRELYYDSDTRSENIEIKTFLSEYKVQAELVLINKDKKEYIIKRDLFPRGKKYIFDKTYNENDFWNELKKIIFDLNEDKPTFRQLIPKFIRLDNTAEDRIIKFLPMMTSNDTYDLVYCFLFQIYGEVLLNKRSEINDKILECQKTIQTSVYKGYKRDKIEMRGDRAKISDFPLYLNTVAGGLDCRDQTIGGFSFVVKIYAVPVVEIIGQLLYLLGRYGFNAQFSDCL